MNDWKWHLKILKLKKALLYGGELEGGDKKKMRTHIKKSITNFSMGIYRKTLKLFAGSGLRSIPFVEKINLFVRGRLQPEFIVTKKYNHKIYLDKIDSLYLSVHKDFGGYEKELIEKQIKKGDIVLDVGANIGFYTLIMAKLVGKTGRVFAFEACPTNFKILQKNVEANGYKNIVLINKAVTNSTKNIDFYIDEKNTAGNGLSPKKGITPIEVPSIRLDDYFPKKSRVDFIKIDIEGSEFLALLGSQNLLEENPKVKIITEFFPQLLNLVGSSPKDYLNFLTEKKFKLYNISEKNKSTTLKLNGQILDNLKKDQWTNLLLLQEAIAP